jgi:hypothetical protein
MDRIAGGLLDLRGGQLDAARLGACLDLVADAFLDLAPVAVERGNELAPRTRGPIRALPRRPIGVPQDVGALVLQALKERPPFRVDPVRIRLVAGIEVLDVVGVAAVKERGLGECGVGILAGHAAGPVWRVSGKGYEPGRPMEANPAR